MKKILVIILVIIFISCNYSNQKESSENKSSEQEPITKERSLTEEVYILTDISLKSNSEKIVLISTIKNVPVDVVNSVLREYKVKTFLPQDKMEDQEYITKIVDSVAKINNLSKKMTASIIFSYEYELITRDEIIEDYKGKIRDF